ncbi:MAG: HIT domain-containing protein [Anaeroplasmataceae bacterium]|nr:HIT domain-containing protein [Anaeroplasmataceae bacterium]
MKHTMKLWDKSFQAIRQGYKTIELRLNDEKRRQLQIGDVLAFQNTTTKDTLECVVLDKRIFPSFKELYEVYDKISLGYQEYEMAQYEDMWEYYSKEKIEAYGALAIHLCKLENITPSLLIDYGICPTCFNKEYHSCLYGDISNQLLYADDKLECFFVGNPRSKGHTIISTKTHYKDMLEAPKEIISYVYCLAQKVMVAMKEVFSCESVYLCTMCDGPMNHFHIQLIPRYKEEQRGSRNFIKERKNYILDEEKLKKMRKLLEENIDELSGM